MAHPSEIAFFGFARPAFGSIPPTTEMQVCRSVSKSKSEFKI